MNLLTTVIAHERSIFHWVGDTVYYAAWHYQVVCFGDASWHVSSEEHGPLARVLLQIPGWHG